MTISMGIEDRTTGAFQDVPVCTSATFRQFWLPAAKELRLEMIESLPALWITAEYRDQFLRELDILDAWVGDRLEIDDYFVEMRRRIDTIAKLVRETPLEQSEISFG